MDGREADVISSHFLSGIKLKEEIILWKLMKSHKLMRGKLC